MAKAVSPLVGYNNNVRHLGQVFHIQTEDSGIKHPHVITHVFADGGRIIATRRTSYAEHLKAPDLPDLVKGIMKEQHKAVFLALRSGSFDDSFDTGKVTIPDAVAPAIAEPEQTPSLVTFKDKSLNEVILSFLAEDLIDD